MTRKEVSQMLGYAMACYPTSQIKDPKKMLDVWTDIFAGVYANDAIEAMKAACISSKYFPTVADVMAEIKAKKDQMRGYIEC